MRNKLSPLTTILMLSGIFFILFVMISGGVYLYKSPAKSTTSAGKNLLSGSDGLVGIIEVNGVIMDSRKTLARLQKFEDDEDVKAVVLRLNSPGGSVAPSQEIYEAVRAYKKPLVVSMASVAASGAYYIACGAKKVYANAGTITGSIGVIMEFVNIEKLYDWAKIHRYAIKTGRFKDTGAEYRDLTPEERVLMQGMVDNVLGQFKQAVVTGRNLKLEDLEDIADGRLFSGAQAKEAQLVDELGTLQDAVNDAGKQAGIQGKPEVVYPEQGRRRILDLLLDDGSYRDESARAPAHGLSAVLSDLIRVLLGRADPVLGGDTESTVLVPGIYWLWKGGRW